MSQKIYNYNPETKVFTGQTLADESPLEPGVFLVPANATTEAPPDCGETEIQVFNEGTWLVKAVPQPEGPRQKTQAEIDADDLAAYKQQAQSNLDKSDRTLLRCFEHGISVPAEWVAYRELLRSVIRAETVDPSTSLPDRPAYPIGT